MIDGSTVRRLAPYLTGDGVTAACWMLPAGSTQPVAPSGLPDSEHPAAVATAARPAAPMITLRR